MTWRMCPECKASATIVVDSRWYPAGAVRRRHVCKSKSCGYRFTTVERILEEGERAVDFGDPLRSARQTVMWDIARFLKQQGAIDLDDEQQPSSL